MAALTPVQIELANSLTQDELPTKLRCAICSKLAVNAFRLPCCETAICESCQSTLPSSCPVCEHSPVSGADCTIYKSLRTTIRVFLKTEEKKREAVRPKTNGSAPPTPIEPTSTLTVAQNPTEPPSASEAINQVKDDVAEAPQNAVDEQSAAVASPQQDASVAAQQVSNADDVVVNPSGEQDANKEQTLAPSGQDTSENADMENADESVETVEGKEGELGVSFGQDSMNGAFNGMNIAGGDMNQMQMMMAMQNGMNPAAFGSFPVIGMGMGMDPMTMQNMYMNGGFGAQGMGMSGMNMNMGMNGFNGDWNGQQSWNVGQDNYNPNAAGMGNGDFGNFNSGFRTGYNSGNYGHQNQFNDYGRGGYGFRGRGRARGFYRGYSRGYHQGYNPRNMGNQMWTEQMAQQDFADSAEQTGEEQKAINTNTDEFGRTVRSDAGQIGQTDDQNGHNNAGENGEENPASHESTGQVPPGNAPHSAVAHDDATMYNGNVSSSGQFTNSGGGSIDGNGAVPAVVDVPLNAPTGPKAMRQGLPNTSALHLRARGFIGDGRSPMSGTNVSIVESSVEERPVSRSRSGSRHSRKDADRRHGDHGRDRDHEEGRTRKDYDKDGDREYQSKTHSRSRSRSSRSRDRKESRRHRRHRSESVTDDREDEYRRRKHKSRRSTREDDDYKRRTKDDRYDDRSRSASPDDRDRDREHKRSSHRSHRDRDRDREKDKERDSDKDRHRKSAHRSHRDHDREKDKDREKDRDRDRRERDRDREHRHRSRKTSTEPPTPVESSDKDFKPPTGPRGSISIKGASSKGSGFEIKGASGKPSSSSSQRRETADSSRRPSQSSISINLKSGSAGKDPHTLERETRDRERLLKEAQRMAGLAGMASMKRSRDAGDDRGGRRKRRSEVSYGDEEERMRKLEAEREGGRWD
ncbi:uncharacterized protein BCR38DRAFT_405223 [Pseudomassariella vexata]|uniref:RING-type domain-containing protein n=1 Tax=Pseudomassariella vexata TaxID=1141098 RepID=A0A1Y2ED77_9PEZI|nr:uncharacterized protein BCR38DRAFT_405223 [Pseudomassariella vexata]ORY69512.1 hypothetical protein BCR38DRAFT_405223 [Pseudomassariella vexata]